MSLTVNKYPRGFKMSDLTAAQDYPIVQTFGSIGGLAGWVGGACAKTGDIYCAPYSNASVLKISPNRDYSFVGWIPGVSKWEGMVMAPNGYLYGIPSDETRVLKVDPYTDSVSVFGSLSSDTQKWKGGVLANNGMIYGIPFNSTEVLKIDPTTDTATTFGSLLDLGSCVGGALALNGKIYCMPYGATAALVIDPDAETVNTLFDGDPNIGPSAGTWSGAIHTYSNKILGIPRGHNEWLEIDPETDTYRLLNTFDHSAYAGGLAPNKKLYTAAVAGGGIYEYDIRNNVDKTLSITGPYQTRSWASKGIMNHKGNIYYPPFNCNRILEISRVGQVTEDMYTMPTNIAGLSRSNYNRHMNHF